MLTEKGKPIQPEITAELAEIEHAYRTARNAAFKAYLSQTSAAHKIYSLACAQIHETRKEAKRNLRQFQRETQKLTFEQLNKRS